MSTSPGWKPRLLALFFAAFMSAAALSASPPMTLSQFDQKASRGEPVSVVFFGGSLTWGANASDPGTTSYRGRMMRYLQDRYPKTSIRFHDAAIGGSGSALGIFRLGRDVLPYKPDLVFLDFTVNDGEGMDMEALATYERCLRSILQSGSGVMPILMCFKYHMAKLDDPLPPRHQSHLALAGAYHLPVANIFSHVQSEIKAQRLTTDDLWNIGKDEKHPADGAHPGDEGYAVFFEVVKNAYEKAVASNDPMVIPEKNFFEDKYPQLRRLILTDGNMPQGWKQRKTYRTSLWFDGLASRWMGDVATASASDSPAPLVVKFRGSMVGIFGERDSFTPPIKVFIDEQPVQEPKAKEGDLLWKLDTSRFAAPRRGSGNLFSWVKLADVPDGEHTLRIEPVFDGTSPDAQLRIESVCSAGR